MSWPMASHATLCRQALDQARNGEIAGGGGAGRAVRPDDEVRRYRGVQDEMPERCGELLVELQPRHGEDPVEAGGIGVARQLSVGEAGFDAQRDEYDALRI